MMCSIISTQASPQRSVVRRGVSTRCSTVAGIRGQPGRSAANEDDARSGRGGPELDAHVVPAPVSDALNHRRGEYRSLISCCFHPEVPVIHDKLRRKSSSSWPAILGRRATSRFGYLTIGRRGLMGCVGAAASRALRSGRLAVHFLQDIVGDVQAAI